MTTEFAFDIASHYDDENKMANADHKMRTTKCFSATSIKTLALVVLGLSLTVGCGPVTKSKGDKSDKSNSGSSGNNNTIRKPSVGGQPSDSNQSSNNNSNANQVNAKTKNGQQSGKFVSWNLYVVDEPDGFEKTKRRFAANAHAVNFGSPPREDGSRYMFQQILGPAANEKSDSNAELHRFLTKFGNALKDFKINSFDKKKIGSIDYAVSTWTAVEPSNNVPLAGQCFACCRNREVIFFNLMDVASHVEESKKEFEEFVGTFRDPNADQTKK